MSRNEKKKNNEMQSFVFYIIEVLIQNINDINVKESIWTSQRPNS